MILFISYLVVPFLFIIRLWKNQDQNLENWIVESIIYLAFILGLFFGGGWPLSVGYYARYFFLLIFVLAVIKSFLNIKRSFLFYPINIRRCGFFLINIFLAIFFIKNIIFCLQGFRCPKDSSIDLDFPLKSGIFYILHGGANSHINHHYSLSAQRFALDILGLNRYGFRSNCLMPKALTDYVIFESPVYSPCDGVVLEAIDEFEDNKPSEMNPNNPAGNYIAISVSHSDKIVLLAHLMNSSVLVKSGEFIQKGQLLAKVGNSGNTSEPHLHIQTIIKGTGDLLYTSQGVPMKFGNKFLVRNDKIEFNQG